MEVKEEPHMIQEFKTFITRGNVVDLAVAFIMGAAFTSIVNSLVNDIIMPPLGLLMRGLDFTNLFLDLSGGDYATVAAAKEAGVATINYGLFINAVITFLITAFSVFLIAKWANHLLPVPVEEPPGPTPDQVLLAEIRDLLKSRAESGTASSGTEL
jgi:large conductance mechanosensitive channel